jgi:hypothetical protein
MDVVNLVFELVAIGFGMIVLRGILRFSLSRRWVIRFLMCGLGASIAGLLPFSGHHTPVQILSMISVYCSVLAAIPLLKSKLPDVWHTIFILSTLAVLYLSLASTSIQLLNCVHIFVSESTGPFLFVRPVMLLYAVPFSALACMALVKSRQ